MSRSRSIILDPVFKGGGANSGNTLDKCKIFIPIIKDELT